MALLPAQERIAVNGVGVNAIALAVTPPDVAAAYAVQGQVLRRLGRVRWKMALLGGRGRQFADMPAAKGSPDGVTVAGLSRMPPSRWKPR